MHRRTFPRLRTFIQALLILGMAVSLLHPQMGVSAAASLTIEPLTWNVIGLDSNNVNVGPNHYPVGARVCNDGDSAATDVTATFVWDSANAFIPSRNEQHSNDLQPGRRGLYRLLLRGAGHSHSRGL